MVTAAPSRRALRFRAFALVGAPLAVAACWSGAVNKENADRQVYGILEENAALVTGQRKSFSLERPVDTLRARLLAKPTEPVKLSLLQALDVAAENSREFQRQKEQLYLVALSLTRTYHDFSLNFDFGGVAEVFGTSDDAVDVSMRGDLSAAATSTAGTRVVASFVNTFLRSVVFGQPFDGSSIFALTVTQPLMRGAGRRIAREPLTQAERDVIYQTRAFERFRAEFAVNVVSDYWDVVRQVADLESVEANYRSRLSSRQQTEALYIAGRRTIVDLGQDRQSEFTADAQRVTARNALQAALDRFKLTLGLPVTANVELDQAELANLQRTGVAEPQLEEANALLLALQRRYDHRTVVDEVEDAGRRVLVSEDALGLGLDFTAVLDVPAEAGIGLNLDWSRVNWAAGFQLDLALDNLVERNAYRSALIAMDAAIRAREQSEDEIAADVRATLRNIRSAYDRYKIQVDALVLAEKRVEATTDLYAAGRIQARERVDAQDSLLQAQLDVTAAIVQYAVARLELMRDLEAVSLEPKGLRFDPALPLPQPQPRAAED